MNFGGCVKDALKNKATLSLSFLTMAAQNGTAVFEKKANGKHFASNAACPSSLEELEAVNQLDSHHLAAYLYMGWTLRAVGKFFL